MSIEQGALIESILGMYPIRQASAVGLMEASNRNENYLVADEGGRQYVLRRYRRNRELARVAFQLRFQKHLLANGFPTAPIVLTKEGTDFVIHDDIPWALFGFIEGSEYDFERMGQVAQAARRLAEFHAIADSFTEPPVDLEWEPPLEYYWVHNADERQHLQDLLYGQGIETELAYLLSWWEELMRQWPVGRYRVLPAGLVHGDYHGRNMVFKGDNITGVFDFDVLGWGARVLDLSFAFLMFGRERRPRPQRIRPAVGRLFVEEYARYRPIIAEEFAAIPAFVVLNRAPTASWLEYRQRDVGADPRELVHDSLAYMRELEAEMARLAPEFGWRL